MNRSLAALAGLTLLWAALAAQAAELRILVKDHHGKLLADAVVLASPADLKSALHAKAPLYAVDQMHKQFVPYVTAVLVGSMVRFPNSDNIRHQVYSFSPAKKFELPLYGGTSAPPVVFDTPGVVVLGCNIHDWMVGYIYVSATPYFAKTEEAGSAIIDDLPPGDYTLRVWHPNIEHEDEAATRRVTLSADHPTSVEWVIPLKPSFRVPRVSGAGAAGYP
jgi:plastocyanin